MSKLTEIVNNIITKTNSKTNTSIPVSSQLTGTYSLSNTVKTLGAGKFLYTGNGTSQEINIGVSSIDFTVASNGTGYYHDRVAGTGIVKNDAGTIVDSGEISFKDVAGVDGIIKVHIKSRSISSTNNVIVDSIRGRKYIFTDGTNTEDSLSLFNFTSNGFSLTTSGNGFNASSATYVAYVELYTHIKWGLTSQGKRYIEAYNPVTNMGMIVYQGSGVAGHQIPHSLGVELDYVDAKSLNSSYNWFASREKLKELILNLTNSEVTTATALEDLSPEYIQFGTENKVNNTGNTYVLYYKAKSPIWACGIYTGTGTSGNFVETRDYVGNACKPHELILKATSTKSDWDVMDNKRLDNTISLNLSKAEVAEDIIDININGFTLKSTTLNNTSGVQYFYQAYLIPANYTSDLDGYFDNPTDTTNLQLTDGIFSISKGYTSNGVDNKVVTKTGTITPTGGWIDA